MLRFAKLIARTILGLALLIFGLVWLIQGISDRKLLPIAAGATALAAIATGFIVIIARSRRQVEAAAAISEEKLRAGLRHCPRCTTDFTQATAPKTAQPIHHFVIAIALSLIPMIVGALVLWVYGFSSPESFKAFFMIGLGVAFLAYAIAAVNRLRVHCPACGRVCGTIAAAEARGFPVEPPKTSSTDPAQS